MREMTLSDCEFVLYALVLGAMALIGSHSIYALSVPHANDTITTKITDTLKSITSNVSTSIQSDVDKVISDTMDIMINNALNQLSNATILENSDASTVKFQPRIPSSVDISSEALPVSHGHGSLDR